MEMETQEKIAFGGLAALVGVAIGTFDVLISGMPYVTIGLPIWEYAKVLYNYKMFSPRELDEEEINPLTCFKKFIPHGLGANIPFAIEYHEEIMDFANQAIDLL